MDRGSHPNLTHEDLKNYDGVLSEKVYLALKGHVLDVTGSEFYKPGGVYHCFAGRDASVGQAKMSKEEEYADPLKYNWKDSLDEKEKGVLDEWFKLLSQKYTLIGYLADN